MDTWLRLYHLCNGCKCHLIDVAVHDTKRIAPSFISISFVQVSKSYNREAHVLSRAAVHDVDVVWVNEAPENVGDPDHYMWWVLWCVINENCPLPQIIFCVFIDRKQYEVPAYHASTNYLESQCKSPGTLHSDLTCKFIDGERENKPCMADWRGTTQVMHYYLYLAFFGFGF